MREKSARIKRCREDKADKKLKAFLIYLDMTRTDLDMT